MKTSSKVSPGRLALAALLLAVVAPLIAPLAAQADVFSDKLGGFGGFGGGFGASSDPVEISAQFTQPTADRPAVLMITAKIESGYHVYSITQPAGGPQPTRVLLDPSDQFELTGGFASQPEPEIHFDEVAFKMDVEEHHDLVTWYAPITLQEGVDPSRVAISGKVTMQACEPEGLCIPLEFSFTAKLGPGVEIGPLNLTTPPVVPAAPDTSPLTSAGNNAGATGGPAGEPYDLASIRFADTEAVAGGSLTGYLVLAFVGGLALNLMPCVLPVIGLKVMSFVEQAGHSRSQALALNLWYSLGIVAVFWVLGALAILAGLSWGEQFSSVAFNVTMSSIVFVMALSLLGVWEIPIPGFLGSGKAQEAAAQEGALGAVLKGVITTLLATPCIGPGMGPALGWAVQQPPGSVFAVFTALGIGMASPYLLIGARPELVRFLPKPGAWMETFKQFLGFVLLGTVLFLFVSLPQDYLLPTLALLICLGLACWVYAKTPLTATRSERSQTYALCSAISVAGAVLAFGWLHPVLYGEQDASWRDFSLAGLKQLAVDEGKTVMVDFGADWCPNCKFVEETVLHTEEIDQAALKHGVVKMYADNTAYPPEIERTITALGSNGIPLLAIFPGNAPYNPIVFRGIYSKQDVINALEQAGNVGATPSVASLPQLDR